MQFPLHLSCASMGLSFRTSMGLSVRSSMCSSFMGIEVANNRIVPQCCAFDGLACSLGSSRNM
jgi:hypothetical protein